VGEKVCVDVRRERANAAEGDGVDASARIGQKIEELLACI